MAVRSLITLISFLSLAIYSTAFPTTNSLETRATGNTIDFTVNLTWEDAAPNGVTRKIIKTNGSFPAPALHMTVGDTVNFLVHNNLPNETSIHFHGITQLNTPWSDGVPGVSQPAIKAGGSYLYTWTADESGTYFYHAHLRAQIQDGLFGAIIIAPKDGTPQPFAFINNASDSMAAMVAADKAMTPVFVNDWSHYTSAEFHDIEVAANVDNACSDSILINGQGSVYCPSQSDINSYTQPNVLQLLGSQNFTQLTAKGCLPPSLKPVQGPFPQNLAALPQDAYDVCVPSTGNRTVFEVDASAKFAAFSFINTGAFETEVITIDGHKFWVYAVDGQYVVPQLVDEIIVPNGARYTAFIQLNQAPADYTMRVANKGLNQVISGYATVRYKGSAGPSSANDALATINYGGVNLTNLLPFIDPKGAAYPPSAPAAQADVTFTFDIKKINAAYEWTLSGVESYNQTEEDATPLMYQDPSQIPDSDLIIKTKKGQWVDFILKVEGPLAEPHPIHKHSNKAYILGSGIGSFNWSTVAEAAAVLPNTTFNFKAPPLRDTFTTTPTNGNNTWLALRYQVVNPGAFIMHCHMQTHFTGGMAVAILDGIDAWPKVPPQYLNGTGITATLSAKTVVKA